MRNQVAHHLRSVATQRAGRRPAARRAFSLLEFEVALLVLALALAGLLPLVALQSRGLRAVEQRLPAQTMYYLAPVDDTWARKLGASARLTTEAPSAPDPVFVSILDDGDAGYSESGSGWLAQEAPPAFRGDYRSHVAEEEGKDGSGATATWQFTSVTLGWYEVQATWPAAPDRSSNAEYTVYVGATPKRTFHVNQTQVPSGSAFSGVLWEKLTTVWIDGGSVHVTLSAASNGSVAADGLRLVPVGNEVAVLSLERSLNSEDITVQVSVDVVVP